MNARLLLRLAGAALFLAGGSNSALAADPAGWTHDFEAAKKQAAAEHKDLLLNFAGTDWCKWSQKLDDEVMFKDEPRKALQEKFVLVLLDYSRDKKDAVPPEIEAQNAPLRDRFGIEIYPTIFLCDEAARPYGVIKGYPKGPDDYLAQLEELRGHRVKRDEAFSKAEKEGGVGKARTLVEVIRTLRQDLGESMVNEAYAGTLDQIREADPKDESGYFTAIAEEKEMAGKMEELGSQVDRLVGSGDVAGAIALVDQTVKAGNFKGGALQHIKLFHASLLEYDKKFDEALAAIEEARAVDPKSELSARMDEFKELIETHKAEAAAAKEAPAKKEGE